MLLRIFRAHSTKILEALVNQLNALRETIAGVGRLTDSTGGTPGTTIADVGSSFNQATLNNNFASIVAKLNALQPVHFAVSSSATSDDLTASPVLITAAAPTNEATRVALANDIKRVLNYHFADSRAHGSALSELIETDDAETGDSLDSAIALANACKAAFNTHRSESNVHANNDTGNAVAASDATDATSLDTLLAELKTDINAHIQLALAGAEIELID